MTADSVDRRSALLRRLPFLLPVLVFLVLAGYFLWGLNPERNPRDVPSALVGDPLPEVTLPPIAGRDGTGLDTAAIKARGEPALVNVFASWCVPCLAEHPILMRLAERGDVPIYGINYKDAAPEARAWLDRHGDPYTRIGALPAERAEAGIELGIYGVPETYVIDSNGIIRHKETGPITRKRLNKTILPLLDRLGE